MAASPTLLPPTKRAPFVYQNGHLLETSIQFLQKMFDALSLWVHPSDSIDPANNGDLVVEATDNTTLTFKFKGSDGVVRSGTVALA